MIDRARHGRGRLVAAAHVGLWREEPPPLSINGAALDEIAPLLLSSGSAPLVWRRLRTAPPTDAASTAALRDAFRYQTLQADVQARDLAAGLGRLADAGVRPLLARGWAACRLYPDPSLRPYVDHDLAVRPDELARARAALAGGEWRFDLHAGFADLDDRAPAALLARAAAVTAGGVAARVLAPEDHLRHLCLHLARHGAWRPLWLCDVAAAVERDGLDWELVAAGDARRTRAVACVLGLARALLDARDTPLSARDLPRWLVPTVLSEWGKRARYAEPLLGYLARPRTLPLAVRDHFPNPIAASAELGAPFDDRPRAPYQLLAALRRARDLLR